MPSHRDRTGPGAVAAAPLTPAPDPPAGFAIRRDAALGRHPLLGVFPGLDRLPTAHRQEPDPAARRALYGQASVEIVADDVWMYVAPQEPPPGPRRRGWAPVLAPEADVIVIGEGHLRTSPALTLFLDIFHEICHLQQRHRGAELFDRSVPYVEKPTEVEAYRFVVDEARAFGVPDDVLREYLRVEWISEREHRQLLATMGVAPAGPAPATAGHPRFRTAR